jgi:hypothetical protein
MRVAVVKVGEDPAVNSAPDRRLAKFFQGQGIAFRDLLTGNHGGAVRQRVIGALMHILQDSYAAGHAERNSDGRIFQVHCSIDQDEQRHADGDKVVDGGIDRAPGALPPSRGAG